MLVIISFLPQTIQNQKEDTQQIQTPFFQGFNQSQSLGQTTEQYLLCNAVRKKFNGMPASLVEDVSGR